MKYNDLGALLINLRKKHNYTQDDISEKMHVTRQAVSKWENNTSLPDVFTIVKLGKLYNAPLLGAFYGEDFASEFNRVMRTKLFKRILLIWFIITTALLLFFGLYYAYNHNSNHSYNIFYEDDHIIINDMTIDIKKHNAILRVDYISISDINPKDLNDYSITMYYNDGKDNHNIIVFSKPGEYTLSNSIDYTDIFNKIYKSKYKLLMKIEYIDYKNEYRSSVIEPSVLLKNKNNDYETNGINTQIAHGGDLVFNRYEYCGAEYYLSRGFKWYDAQTLYKKVFVDNNDYLLIYVNDEELIFEYSSIKNGHKVFDGSHSIGYRILKTSTIELYNYYFVGEIKSVFLLNKQIFNTDKILNSLLNCN
jgi:transcriptional regulator with XRE-family HTH domain